MLDHLVADGWSARIIIDELKILYEHECGYRCVPPPPVEADHVADLPFSTQSTNGSAMESDFAETFLESIAPAAAREFARKSHVTVHMLCLAAWYIVLHHITGKQKLGIWTHLANRSMRGTSNAVGWYAHTHLLGAEVHRDFTICELFGEVRKQVAGACTDEHMPLHLLWQLLRTHPQYPDAGVVFNGYPYGADETSCSADT